MEKESLYIHVICFRLAVAWMCVVFWLPFYAWLCNINHKTHLYNFERKKNVRVWYLMKRCWSKGSTYSHWSHATEEAWSPHSAHMPCEDGTWLLTKVPSGSPSSSTCISTSSGTISFSRRSFRACAALEEAMVLMGGALGLSCEIDEPRLLQVVESPWFIATEQQGCNRLPTARHALSPLVLSWFFVTPLASFSVAWNFWYSMNIS